MRITNTFEGSENPMLLTSTVDVLNSCVHETTYSTRNGNKWVSFQFLNIWGAFGTISQNPSVPSPVGWLYVVFSGFSLLIWGILYRFFEKRLVIFLKSWNFNQLYFNLNLQLSISYPCSLGCEPLKSWYKIQNVLIVMSFSNESGKTLLCTKLVFPV